MMSEECPRCGDAWCSGTVDRRCARLHVTRDLWWTCRCAAYQIAFDWEPWKTKGAGRFAGLRAAFRAFGPAMQCYALTAQGLGPKVKVATDDKVAEATEARGRAMELD